MDTIKQNIYDKLVAFLIADQAHFYRYAYSYVRNPEDALDIVQNAVCKALEHYETLKNEEAVRSWFYRILANECLFLLNTRKKYTLTEDQTQLDGRYEEKGYDHPDDLTKQIDQLEPDVGQIIRLRFFEEMSLKEIADIVEMNLNTVKAKLYRGLKSLKIVLQKEEEL